MGSAGPAGPTGNDGHEGGTPYLLSDTATGVITYGDGTNVIEIKVLGNPPQMPQKVLAPGAGALLVRAYFHGTVSKRAGARACVVSIGLRRDQETLPFATQNIGIFDASEADQAVISVSGVLAGKIEVPAGAMTQLHVEIQRNDNLSSCAPGSAGGTAFAAIQAQLELSFYRINLSVQ
jgi:hypothetical protein